MSNPYKMAKIPKRECPWCKNTVNAYTCANKQIIHTIFCPVCFGYIGDSGKQYRQSDAKLDKS